MKTENRNDYMRDTNNYIKWQVDLSKQGFQMSSCMEHNFSIYAWSGHLQEASYIFIVKARTLAIQQAA